MKFIDKIIEERLYLFCKINTFDKWKMLATFTSLGEYSVYRSKSAVLLILFCAKIPKLS